MAQTFPTKANLLNSKKSLELAKTGYELMDKKRNILMREMTAMLQRASQLEHSVNEAYKDAYEAFIMATVNNGSLRRFAMMIPAEDNLKINAKSIMGVEIPTVECPKAKNDVRYFGFDNTGSYLDEACEKMARARELAVELAQVHNSICRLADAVRKTRKRSNALSNIMIPRLEQTVKHISEVLDEAEREDFSRLKVTKSISESKK